MLIDIRTEVLNLYFLCPFIGCFCLIGSSLVSNNSIFGNYPFLKIILNAISKIFSFIPYLIYKKIKANSLEKKIINKSSDDKLIFEKIETEKNNAKIWTYIFLGFIDFLYTFILYLGRDLFSNKKFKLYFMSSNILFLIIFQRYILKGKIYRYQISSLIIFFILDAVYIIIVILDKILMYNMIEIIFICASNCLFILELTCIKNMLNRNSTLLFRICILVGIFSLCFNLIATTITSVIEHYVDVKDKNKLYLFSYKYYLNAVGNNIVKEIILIFVFVVLNCIYNILQLLAIKYLSSNHVLITYIMLAIYSSIIMKIQNVEMTLLTFIFSIILYIIFFFVFFIFLDIIQLNFCGISKEMTNKLEFKSDVDKYMQSFSSIDDNEINNEISTNINSTEMDEKSNSVDSSDLDSNN